MQAPYAGKMPEMDAKKSNTNKMRSSRIHKDNSAMFSCNNDPKIFSRKSIVI